MNPLGAIAVILSLIAFTLTYRFLRQRSILVRLVCFLGFALLAIPSVIFTVYYLHILPERAWFYSLRSWAGTEFLVVFLGCATAAVASLLPRFLLGVPLFVLLAISIAPYVKPLLGPIPDNVFRELWEGDICLQITPSTCGPASVATILRHLGSQTTERATARAAFSYAGGTEAWYLARYVRTKGFTSRFEFCRTFSPSVGAPAIVGVRIGGAGHFIAVLAVTDDQVTFADPLRGEERMTIAQFQRRYEFTGFHMVISSAMSPKPAG
jgi:hypothetical protein